MQTGFFKKSSDCHDVIKAQEHLHLSVSRSWYSHGSLSVAGDPLPVLSNFSWFAVTGERHITLDRCGIHCWQALVDPARAQIGMQEWHL